MPNPRPTKTRTAIPLTTKTFDLLIVQLLSRRYSHSLLAEPKARPELPSLVRISKPGPSKVGNIYGLPRGGALRHGIGELHVAHPVLEAGARDLLAAADGVDELLLDAPADPLLLGDGNLLQLLVAASPAGHALGIGFEPQRSLAA